MFKTYNLNKPIWRCTGKHTSPSSQKKLVFSECFLVGLEDSVLKTLNLILLFDRMFAWFLSTIRRKLFTSGLKLIWVTMPREIDKGNSNSGDQLKKFFFVWSLPFGYPQSISSPMIWDIYIKFSADLMVQIFWGGDQLISFETSWSQPFWIGQMVFRLI